MYSRIGAYLFGMLALWAVSAMLEWAGLAWWWAYSIATFVAAVMVIALNRWLNG